MFSDRIKPMVAFLAAGVFALALVFGLKLISILEAGEGSEFVLAVVAILSMIVGIGVGGLMTLAGQVATDPPAPSVPAAVHLQAIETVKSMSIEARSIDDGK